MSRKHNSNADMMTAWQTPAGQLPLDVAARNATMPAIKTLAMLPCGRYDEHANWFIGPVGHHRDSDVLEQSNWVTVLNAFGLEDPDQKDHEIHQFGHWAVGWIEEIAYRPGSKIAALAEEFRKRLADYPVLNEELMSQLEEG